MLTRLKRWFSKSKKQVTGLEELNMALLNNEPSNPVNTPSQSELTEVDMDLLESEPSNPPIYDFMEEKGSTSTSSELITARLISIKEKLEPSYFKSLYPKGFCSMDLLKDAFVIGIGGGLFSTGGYLVVLMSEYLSELGAKEKYFNTAFVNGTTGVVVNATCQSLTAAYIDSSPADECRYQLSQATPKDIVDLCSNLMHTMCELFDGADLCIQYGILALILGLILEVTYFALRTDKQMRLAIKLDSNDVLTLHGAGIVSNPQKSFYDQRNDYLRGIERHSTVRNNIFSSSTDPQAEGKEMQAESKEVVIRVNNPSFKK